MRTPTPVLAAPAAVLGAHGQAGAALEAFPVWVLGPGRMRRLGRLAGSALAPACSAGSAERAGREQMQAAMISGTVFVGSRAVSSSGTYCFGGLYGPCQLEAMCI